MNKIYHTSPKEITKINPWGGVIGNGVLCFSDEPYVMTGAENYITYSMNYDSMEFISASRLFYHPDASKLQIFVEELASLVGCDTDTAEALISEEESVWNIDLDADKAELDWHIQGVAAVCAKALGFDGCVGSDEQGKVYLVPMIGREADLIKE